MYIKDDSKADFINKVNERISNNPGRKKPYGVMPLRTPYTHFGNKTWPEVIRLYRESKKGKNKRS